VETYDGRDAGEDAKAEDDDEPEFFGVGALDAEESWDGEGEDEDVG
jgi:hypothetical protein